MSSSTVFLVRDRDHPGALEEITRRGLDGPEANLADVSHIVNECTPLMPTRQNGRIAKRRRRSVFSAAGGQKPARQHFECPGRRWLKSAEGPISRIPFQGFVFSRTRNVFKVRFSKIHFSRICSRQGFDLPPRIRINESLKKLSWLSCGSVSEPYTSLARYATAAVP